MIYAIFGLLFIFLMTSLGAFSVFIPFKNKNASHYLLSFAGGVMLAASIFSLLIKALEYNSINNYRFYVLMGLIFGALFILLIDIILQKFNKQDVTKKKMFIAMTTHNIPEGLSVGLSFGICLYNNISLIPSLILALGIGIQNFPEGASTALFMYKDNKKKAFLYGIVSGLVEPLFGLIGLFLAAYLSSWMPFVLSFGAGAMLYVIVDELIITKGNNKNKIYSNLFFLLGFMVMMILDIYLG